MHAAVLSPVDSSRVILFDEELFHKNFNQRWFPLEHTLASHPLFDLERLIVLAKQTSVTRPDDLYFDKGATGPGQRWNETPTCDLPIEEAIRRIEYEGAWIILKHAQKDPEYNNIIERTMREVLELTGRELERQVKYAEVILFITSPQRLTTYHIDRECNFVAQIRGNKTIYIFDKFDREVTPETELEKFWAVDNNAAVYKPHLQSRASEFLLQPGNGVHIPVNAPHWLQNHDNISITASLNFKFRDPVLANVYRANYVLRRLGIQPLPPGRSRGRDAMKRSAVWAGQSLWNATPAKLRDGLKRVAR
ncbi:MAG TPA: hypothetical protein VKU01_35965 [Bryobacteraceae bacterium]|nr:hypothetical protein [Bryobacteraceae bacterium]